MWNANGQVPLMLLSLAGDCVLIPIEYSQAPDPHTAADAARFWKDEQQCFPIMSLRMLWC